MMTLEDLMERFGVDEESAGRIQAVANRHGMDLDDLDFIWDPSPEHEQRLWVSYGPADEDVEAVECTPLDPTARALAEALAGLVAWYGKEDNAGYVRRLVKAERLLRRLAPKSLKEHRLAARAAAKEE